MHRTSHRTAALALGLALLGAGALAAAPKDKLKKQTIKVTPTTQTADGAKVIALQVWVENLTAGTKARYGVAPTAEPIPARQGDRLRLRLVGTAIEADGDGVEIPIEARFEHPSGRHALEIEERGSNWVMVESLGRDTDHVQLAFEVTGRYDLRPAMTQGRLTFDLGAGGAGGIGTSIGGTPITDRDRLRRAEELASRLYQSILRVDDRAVRLASGYDEAVDRIYRHGPDGAFQIAVELAREGESRQVYRGVPSRDVVEHLYRTLLVRTVSDEELLADNGFVGNVRLYEREGLDAVVDVIARSSEFRDTHDLGRLGVSAIAVPRQ